MNILITILFGTISLAAFVGALTCFFAPNWSMKNVIIPLFGSKESKSHYANKKIKWTSMLILEVYGVGIILLSIAVILFFDIMGHI